MKFLNSTNLGLLIIRVLAGAGMSYHGYGKIFGGKMSMFTEGVASMGVPFPEVSAWAAALAEFAGGIFLAIGLGTRFAALSIVVTMAVAAFVAHSGDPFGKKELALAYLTMSSGLFFTGAGRFSVDHKLFSS